MATQAAERGGALADGGRPLAALPRWVERIWGGGFSRLLDRIDAGLAHGSVRVRLPGGPVRVLGGRSAGFEADAEIRDWRALLRLATAGSVGCYQGWEAGEWDSSDPVALFALFCANAATLGQAARARGPWRWLGRLVHRLHRNTRSGAERNIHAHYDLGNDFYGAWLDSTMIYSSALFGEDHAGTRQEPSHVAQFFSELSHGQSNKVAAIDRRLALREGDRVLEIGAGWGTVAAFLAEKYDAEVVALSLSDEQIAFAQERWKGIAAGSVDYRKQDYRDVHGTFDAIVSIEMVEAVGQDFWPDFFDCLDRNLAPGGRAALQFITIDERVFPAYAAGSDFIQTYIFPGGMLVSEAAFRKLAAERGLEWHDQVNFGADYAETLWMWQMNFERAAADGQLPDGFDDRFVRLWRFYLMYCQGGFMGGLIDVSQVTLVKPAKG